MMYHDFDKAQKITVQNEGFVFGEHEAGRKHYEDKFGKFQLNAKGRGKSRKAKIALATIMLSQPVKDEDVIIVDPESIYMK